MKKYNLKKFTKGWFIGNFDPTILKTNNFEVAIKSYNEGDYEEKHCHKIATEFTIILSGVFKMNNNTLKEDDIIMIKPNEYVNFKCVKSGKNAVIKIPSVKNDKYLKK